MERREPALRPTFNAQPAFANATARQALNSEGFREQASNPPKDGFAVANAQFRRGFDIRHSDFVVSA
jgi:hypothetical protein